MRAGDTTIVANPNIHRIWVSPCQSGCQNHRYCRSPEPLTQSLAGPRDISPNVFEQGPKFAVLGLRIEEVSILRLEISDLLATQDCAYQRSSLRYHVHKREILPAWCQTFEQLPHGNYFIMRFSEVCGAIFHFDDRIGSSCMSILDPVKIRGREIEVLTHLG